MEVEAYNVYARGTTAALALCVVRRFPDHAWPMLSRPHKTEQLGGTLAPEPRASSLETPRMRAVLTCNLCMMFLSPLIRPLWPQTAGADRGPTEDELSKAGMQEWSETDAESWSFTIDDDPPAPPPSASAAAAAPPPPTPGPNPFAQAASRFQVPNFGALSEKIAASLPGGMAAAEPSPGSKSAASRAESVAAASKTQEETFTRPEAMPSATEPAARVDEPAPTPAPAPPPAPENPVVAAASSAATSVGQQLSRTAEAAAARAMAVPTRLREAAQAKAQTALDAVNAAPARASAAAQQALDAAVAAAVAAPQNAVEDATNSVRKAVDSAQRERDQVRAKINELKRRQ